MEMLLSNLDFLTYDGYINITFGLNESTNLLLFHNGGNEVPLFQYLLDKDGNKIDIECVGAFLDFRNDYFVMRTARYKKSKINKQNCFIWINLFLIILDICSQMKDRLLLIFFLLTSSLVSMMVFSESDTVQRKRTSKISKSINL